MTHEQSRRPSRALIGAIALVASAAALTGCRPEAEPTAAPTQTIIATPTASASGSPAPTPTPTATGDAFAVPEACEDIYSASMLETLQDENPPLNDPDVTMLSTQDVDLLEVIDAAPATIRCSWGGPGEFGLATNVTVVDAEQGEFVVSQLTAAGLTCEPLGDGTVCRGEQKGVTLDDEEYTSGETHYVGAGGWVSTAWLNFHPDDYTEDIVDTLWGT